VNFQKFSTTAKITFHTIIKLKFGKKKGNDPSLTKKHKKKKNNKKTAIILEV
jgi:hypothetical protein